MKSVLLHCLVAISIVFMILIASGKKILPGAHSAHESMDSTSPAAGSPVILPADALTIQPVQKATRERAHLFREVWTQDQAKIVSVLANLGLDSTPPDTLLTHLVELQPQAVDLQPAARFLDCYEKVVQQDDYEIMILLDKDWLSPQHITRSIPFDITVSGDISLTLMTATRLLALKAWWLLEQGRIEEASRQVECILRGARHHRYDLVGIVMLTSSMAVIAADTGAEVLRRCDSPEIRAIIAQRQAALAAALPRPPFDMASHLYSSLGILRELRRRGMIVDVQGLSEALIVQRTIDALGEYFSACQATCLGPRCDQDQITTMIREIILLDETSWQQTNKLVMHRFAQLARLHAPPAPARQHFAYKVARAPAPADARP